jgi:hypothetical protein
VRIAVRPHENRATNAAVVVESGKQKKAVTVNMQKEPALENGFVSLGVFEFAAGEAAVELSAKGANGYVHADAVQVVGAE